METLPRDKVLDLDLAMENGLLCETLMAQKKYAEAEQYAKKKLALEESLLHSDDAVLVHSLTLIGDCEIQQEQFAGAEPFYKRASEIARLQKFPTLGNLLLTLARTEAQLKEFSKAETYKQQALAVKHKANQVEFAENMRRLGVAFMRKQQWAEADACYQEAAEILASIHQDSSPTMAMLTANRGRLCYRQEQYAQAEILYQKAMSMIKTTNRPVNKEVWNGMAEVLEKEGKTDQASKLREQLKATASDVAKPVPH
ncbi:MAG: hypothetical protein C5B53_11530 [Candidatus Melainabacteria bacterium]|nr:MAG: hypothetical protein C5B53_11530 [Candidatus Melainabacteria bacterium]